MNIFASAWIYGSKKAVAVAAFYAIAMEILLFSVFISEAVTDGRILRAAVLTLVLALLTSATYLPHWGRSIGSGFLLIFMFISGLVAMPDRDMQYPHMLEKVLGRSPSVSEFFMWVMLVIFPTALGIYVLGRPDHARERSAERPN